MHKLLCMQQCLLLLHWHTVHRLNRGLSTFYLDPQKARNTCGLCHFLGRWSFQREISIESGWKRKKNMKHGLVKTLKLMPRSQESEEVKTRKAFYFRTLAGRWTMHNSQGWTAGDNAFISHAASRCNVATWMSGIEKLHIKMAVANDNQTISALFVSFSNFEYLSIKYIEHWKLHKNRLVNMNWYTTTSSKVVCSWQVVHLDVSSCQSSSDAGGIDVNMLDSKLL